MIKTKLMFAAVTAAAMVASLVASPVASGAEVGGTNDSTLITIAEASTLDEVLTAADYRASVSGNVLRLYRAFFNREPDIGGVKYWLSVQSGGQSLDDIAGHFTLSDEFINTYAGTSDEDYLTAVYSNVLGRDFDQDGFGYWLGLLESGEVTRGGVVRWISDSAEFRNRFPYGLFPGAGTEVISRMNQYLFATMPAAVTEALLAELGFDTKRPTAWFGFGKLTDVKAVARGELHYFAGTGHPHNDQWADLVLVDGFVMADHVSVVGNMTPVGGNVGILVDRKTAEQYGIKSLDQINSNPELVAVFDTDGDGLADINSCYEDSFCRREIDETLIRNGWTNLSHQTAWDHLDYFGEFETVTSNDSKLRLEKGLPTLRYSSNGSGFLHELSPGGNMLWLSMGGEDLVCDGEYPCRYWNDPKSDGPAPLGAKCTDDPCWMMTEWNDLRITANTEFLLNNPAAASLFESIRIPIEDIDLFGAHVRLYGPHGEARDQLTAAWIDENRAVVDQWLDDARRAALQ